MSARTLSIREEGTVGLEKAGFPSKRWHKVPKRLILIISLLTLTLLASAQSGSSSPLTTQTEQSESINFLRTIQVTPDDRFLIGSFARINYVPTTDHFVVTFGTKASTQSGEILGAGYGYKEYTLEMQETGETGLLTWHPNSNEAGDSGSVMVNGIYFCAFVPDDIPGFYGWRVVKFDATNWTRLNEMLVPLPDPYTGATDPMVAYADGQLQISDQFNPSGIWQEGNSSRHYFFSADLQPIGNITLADTPHIGAGSLVFVDDIYYFVSSTSFFDDLVLMKYDRDWNYLGMRILRQQAHFSTGMVFDGEHFYLAYLDTSQRTPQTFFPVYPNVHLAMFDREWNLLDDVAVTNFTLSSDMKAGRPWVILHENRLYVSYDVDTVNKTTEEEQLAWQAYVSIYTISQPTQGETWWWPCAILGAGIAVIAGVAVTYIFLKGRGTE